MSIIIPQKTFNSPFNEILNGVHGVITKSERKLLMLFERYCYQDGQIYPKQATIAYKLNLTVRQVQRLIVSLVQKGFLAVLPPSLVDRHIYGRGNRYHLLDNEAYHHGAHGKMSPEMSPEKQVSTIIENKDIKTKGGFNIVEWLEKNKHMHGQAIVDALNALVARWPSTRLPGRYAQKIVDIKSGNYAEADHRAMVQEEAAEINAGYVKIAEKINLRLPGAKKQEEQDDISERLNRQRNEIFARFG